jgi:hypothetical protein
MAFQQGPRRRQHRRRTPLGYVEDVGEPRTPLEVIF